MRRPKECQYGVLHQRCGRPAPTKRLAPSGRETWDVCDLHAGVLDKLRRRIDTNRHVLDRLADE